MKKLVSLLVVLAMLLSVLPAALAEDATTDYSEWFPGVDTSEHVVLTMLVTGNVPTNKTDEVLAVFNEKLTEAINAEIQIQWIEWADWQTKYQLALAMQDGSIDLVGTATDWLYAWDNARNGGFLALSDEMLQTYAPKTYASVSQEHWDMCKYNGEIYFCPEDNYAQWTNHGFMYRGDWATAAGIEDGDINSWEDLGVYFQYIKDTYPDVIPWDADGSGSSYSPQVAGGYLTDKLGLIGLEGLSVSLFYGTKDDPYTLSRAFIEGDTLVDFAKQMKAWADAGYWREDVLNYSGDVTDELEEGLTGAHQHHTQTWRSERVTMEKEQPGSDLRFFWFGEESDALVALNITHGAMAVAGQSKNPERALMAYDLIRNDETFYRLFNYGIEGEQYIIQDGYLARPDGYDSTLDGVSFDYWWGRNDDLEIRSSEVDWTAYDALCTEEYDPVKIDYPYGKLVFDTDSISVEMDNISNVYNTYMPVITFGKDDDPEAYVAEFRQALIDAGIEDVMAEVQRQIDAVYGD
ncbi:MAG TPA: ABC transporter substrate-binding protein [Candidatus Limiplasma sp.]|nr:ABC transporter substrate-binding protein [Candidatus Limiplasma sp.]